MNKAKNTKRKSGKNQCAFTLVELIVVITILAILGTIAFINLQGYSSQSRDSVRVSDISTMKSGLELFNLDAGKYPIPSEGTMITYSGSLAWTQGFFGEEVVTNLDKLDKVLLDPLTEKKYVYSTTNNRGEYQIAGAMEGDEVSIVNIKQGNLNNIFASEKTARLIISGTYNGQVLRIDTCGIDYLLAIPSIIANSGTTLENIVANKGLAYNGYKNLPFQYEGSYKTDGETDLNLVNTGSIVVFSGDMDLLSDKTNSGQIERADLLTKLQIAYGNTNISSVWEIEQILNVTELDEIDNLATVILSNNLGGSILSCTTSGGTRTVYGDEDAEAIGACNKWVETTIGSSAGGYQNWIWVPARNFVTDGHGTALTDDFYKRSINYNGVDYICNGFAVMKYEAKFTNTTLKLQPDLSWRTWAVSDYYTAENDLFPENLTNGIVSKPGDYPVGYIRQGEAIHACSGYTLSGTLSHLITNNEWMAIARNIEAQAINWSNGIVGSGGIYRGNVNLTDNISYSSSGSTGFRSQGAGNDSDIRGINQIGNRRLILSNNQNIWDLSGNVREHVNKSNVPTTSNIRTSNSGWNSTVYSTEVMCNNGLGWDWYSWNGIDSDGKLACVMINGYTNASYGPLNILNADDGVGRISATDTDDRDNIFFRGGGGNGYMQAGLYALRLYRDAANKNDNTGFRCSW